MLTHIMTAAFIVLVINCNSTVIIFNALRVANYSRLLGPCLIICMDIFAISGYTHLLHAYYAVGG